MKIMATFDGSAFSESIIPTLQQMAALPGAAFVLIAVGDMPSGQRARELPANTRAAFVAPHLPGTAAIIERPPERFAETKEQAVERRIAELQEYLGTIASRLSAGTPCTVEAHMAEDASRTIVERARALRPDVIVMATHGHSGVVEALFGSTAEAVVRSAAAPVLLVHPDGVKDRRDREAA